MLDEHQYNLASRWYVQSVPNLPQAWIERTRTFGKPDVTGVVSRGIHITGMSRVVSSINSPSPGLFRTCRPHGNIRRTWSVPLRRTSVRPALRPRRAPPGPFPTSLAGPVQPAYCRRERNLLIQQLRETPAFHFLLVTCDLCRRPRY